MSQLTGEADIAAVGALLADPGRCRMLVALGDGRALPASRLADEAGVSAATARTHLRKLTDAGLTSVEASGRHRYYRLAGVEVADLIETLQRLAPAAPVRSLRAGTRAKALRDARTCYDHLAGRLGVELMSSLLRAGYLTGGDGLRADGEPVVGRAQEVDYELTRPGRDFFAAFGVVVPGRGRPVVRSCVDWTEQRHHLAGRLGRALRERIGALGWIEPAPTDRAVVVTPAGRAGLAETFGVVGGSGHTAPHGL